MKVIYKDANLQVEKDYPAWDISEPIKGLDESIQFYYIETEKPENPNHDKYDLIKKPDVLTENVHPDYSHLKICERVYELVEKSKDEIINRLNTELGIYLDSNYLPAIRDKHVRELYRLNESTLLTSEQIERRDYLLSLDNWLNECRIERQRREDEYLNNDIFPDFFNYPQKPQKNYMIPVIKVNKQRREILERGNYPRIDGAPIEGLDPDIEWLIINEPFPESQYNYDPRYHSILRSESANTELDEHPNYPGVGQFLITYSLVKNQIAEILNSLEAAENNANIGIMPLTKQLKHIIIGINAIRKLSQGINLQTYENTVLTKISQYAGKIATNYTYAHAKETAINSGLEPDLDSDWINS